MSMMPLVKLAGRIARSNLHELPLPYRLTYAVTSRCQARCAMCNIWQKPAVDELTLAEIEVLFSKSPHFSWINLTGGELFQRPDINDIFHTIINHSRNLYLLNFPTNGFQTGEILAAVDNILKKTSLPRLIVSVSLDGPAHLHDQIRGISGSWQQAIQTFQQLREHRSRRFSVYFGHTLQSANLGKFSETLNACREVLADVTVDDFHLNLAHTSGHYYDNINAEALPEPDRAVIEIEKFRTSQKCKLLDPVSFIENRYQQYIRHYLQHGRAPLTCQAAAASCFIDPAGTVYPCTVFADPIGSLREYDMDLCRLWHSIARLEARSAIVRNRCPGCWTPCEAYQTILANLFSCWKKP